MTDTLPDNRSEIRQTRPVLTRTERAELRLAQQKRHRRIGWVLFLIVLLLAGGGAYLVYGTSVLGLRKVTVTLNTGSGVVESTDEAAASDSSSIAAAADSASAPPSPTAIEFDAPSVAAAAPVSPAGPVLDSELIGQVQTAVAVPSGTPLISVDLTQVSAAVELIPQVADAEVTRQWPGTLHVSVTLRIPVAVVPANSSLYLLDSFGNPYLTVPAVPPGLVTLRLATPGPADPATLAGLTVVQVLPAELVPLLSTVSARSPYDISLELTDGRTVQWGGVSDSVRKGQILPAVLAQQGTAFDISDPALVTVR